MSQDTSKSLVSFEELTRPANTLIEKVSAAVGVLYEPTRIRKKAEAEKDAALTKAESDIEVARMRRAEHRRMKEEAQHQKNMEDIVHKASSELNEDAKPESMENDWVANFFDKCRIVSDDEMQSLWSRVLAGEANVPGSYSKRTVNFLSDMGKAEADLFTNLCGFGWQVIDFVPLIFDIEDEIYNEYRINFSTLSDLESIGLIKLNVITDFGRRGLPKHLSVSYYRRELILEMPLDTNNQLNLGNVILTKTGQELARICKSKPVEGFWEYVKGRWERYLSTGSDDTELADEELQEDTVHRSAREIPASSVLWKSATLEELARSQNVKPMTDIRSIFGTWPGQEDDGFEAAIDALRHPERRQTNSHE